ncbi:Bacteriophage SP-beta, YorD [uncultured Caudovirales phage]|uniref:Bacteriophage SP-beta, YorD n=1 Tax=uncultured Caudovirales phage TaxID=2100421 RepID=A0A6J7WJA3_9CAUD|nr:Bacteriophage SP-beta, YorD [uncultured Caudovirales phage]
MNKATAIMYLYPEARTPFDFIVDNDEKGSFISEWNLSAPKPTDDELEAAWEKVQALEYRAKREAEYPPISDQLDIIFHEGIDAWKAKIQAVKDKYPK